MAMARALALVAGTAGLAGCAAQATGPVAPAGYGAVVLPGGALQVTRAATPFAGWEGAEARRAADAACGGRVAASIYDRFSDGAWIFVGGCA